MYFTLNDFEESERKNIYIRNILSKLILSAFSIELNLKRRNTAQ